MIQITPLITVAVLAGTALVSFGAGYVVENWRTSADIERLQGQNTLLQTSAGKCEADIQNVRAAMMAIETASKERVRQAEEAMIQSEPEVRERTVTITKIKELPVVAPDEQCEAIRTEQIKYVKDRRDRAG